MLKKKTELKSILSVILVVCMMLCMLSGCGGVPEEAEGDAPIIEGLAYTEEMEFVAAKSVRIFEYEEGYRMISVTDGRNYLVVPEGAEAPESLPEDTYVLQQPLDKIYLAATSAMALFRGLNALDHIRLTGTDSSGWYIEEAAEALENGDMLYGGKYSDPDYELLLDESCDLAIESTMILHSPKVQEMLETLEIPVFIDNSSYENTALGRTEWIKVYGVLTGKEAEASEFFAAQKELVEEADQYEKTEKTVAFFYISDSGYAVVHKPTDYVADMIRKAGGVYAFEELQDDTSKSSVNLSVEEFYDVAVDADYLVYNSTIQKPISSVDELLTKSELFADFKAVKEGNVWCVGKNMYQATDITGEFIQDIHHMIVGDPENKMTFLMRVK